MNGIDIKIAQLLINQSGKSRSTVSVFLPPTTPLEKQNLGQILVLTEIGSHADINSQVIELLEEELKNNYYGSENFNIEVAFENALQKTNQKLHELIIAGESSWLENFNCLVAIIKGRELHLTQLGNVQALFIHSNHIINIVDQAGENHSKINPLKIFSNVISGTINESDALLFCTESLLDYLSQEKLRRIILENSPEKATKIINDLLAENIGDISFAAIILRLLGTPRALVQTEKIITEEVVPAHLSAPESSMNQLLGKEKNTSELLSPSLWPNFTKGLKSFWGRLQQSWQKEKPKEKAENILPRDLKSGIKKQTGIMKIFAYLALGLKKLLVLFITLINKTVSLFQNRRTIHSRIRTLPRRTNRTTANLLMGIKNLSNPRKIILLAAVLLIIIFAFNIVNLGKKAESKQQKEGYIASYYQASEKTNEAEAALIYENEEDARILLTEAKNLLAKIPSDQKNLKDKITDLNNKIQTELNKVNHIVKIDDPSQLIDLTQTNSDISPVNLLDFGDQFLVAESKNNAIFIIKKDDQSTGAPENSSSLEGNIQKGIVLTAQHAFFYTSQDKFYDYNLENNSFTNKVVESANVDKQIQDIATYLGRIYTLDTKNNQIFRHEKSTDNYGQGIPWITDKNLDVKNANSFAIDGSIFITKNNGEIWKLFGGTKDTKFKVSTIDPAFSNPTKIIAQADLKNIYILDPNNKRIVVLTKDGVLVNQYFSEQLDNLQDLVVSEKNKTIYLLNGKKIFKLTMEE